MKKNGDNLFNFYISIRNQRILNMKIIKRKDSLLDAYKEFEMQKTQFMEVLQFLVEVPQMILFPVEILPRLLTTVMQIGMIVPLQNQYQPPALSLKLCLFLQN